MIYRFHKSVFDRSVSSVKRLNWVTQNTEPFKTLSTFCLAYCNIIINRRSQYWAINW